MYPSSHPGQIRVETLRDWLEQIEKLIASAPDDEAEAELTALQGILERSGRADGVIGPVVLTEWVNGSGGFLAHEGVTPFQDARLVPILADDTDLIVTRVETLTGISAFSLAIPKETFDAWSYALEDLIEQDSTSSTMRYPDGGRVLTAKPALAELQLHSRSYIHKIYDDRTERPWPKTVMVARGPVVVLRDHHTAEPSRYPRAVERELRDLVKNIERLTGIPATQIEELEHPLS